MRVLELFLVCCFIALNVGQPVLGVSVVPTPKTEFAQASPLLITGYALSYDEQAGGLFLDVVEVANISKAPVRLGDWSMQVATNGGSANAIETEKVDGWLLPNQHVLYASLDHSLPTSSLLMEGVLLGNQASTVKISLAYIASSDEEVRFVNSTIEQAGLSAIKNDTAYFRKHNSSDSDYLTTFAAIDRSFYNDELYEAPVGAEGLKIVEIYPYSSDCAPDDNSILCGDYVKLVNTTSSDIVLDDYVLRTDSSSATRTSSNTVALSGAIGPNSYYVVSSLDNGARLSLTNTGGYVWLEDSWGMARYGNTMTNYAAASASEKGYAYALDGDTWKWTSTPAPDGPNLITSLNETALECPAGKYRNPETGRCRTIEEAVNAMSACEEGYERNPLTNRCRKIITTSPTSLTPCLEGQERNPATNRCRSIANAVAELLPCDEGYERNPDTNRCRKVQASEVPLVGYPVQSTAKGSSDATGWIAFAAVLTLALGYGVWEWRGEIAGVARRGLAIFKTSK